MSILDRYGIKEVCDVTFYALGANGKPTHPVLFLDTLKVSTVEQTAEESTANGGKGNAPLISWDFGKDINVTLEDALFSAKSLAIMFGDGKVNTFASDTSAHTNYIMKTETFIPDNDLSDQTTYPNESTLNSLGWDLHFTAPDGKKYTKKNPKVYADNSTGEQLKNLTKGTTYFVSYDLAASGSVIDISANSFPGTYYVVGETYARSEASGQDEMFQLIFPKAKVKSENTITLEASGDPSVFNMNLHILRPADGVMMRLVPYTLTGEDTNVTGGGTSELVHNHVLNTNNVPAQES